MKKKKINWVNQTEVGRRFGLSAVKLGKILVEKGLKDSNGATQKALKEEYAKKVFLKDGTKFYLWNDKKVRNVVDLKEVDQIEYWLLKIKPIYNEADKCLEDGRDKEAQLIEETMFSDVPDKIRDEVEKIFWERLKD